MASQKQSANLKIANLTVTIQDKLVVDGFSLTIPPGSCHVLMGPNGSGKSSLAYALAGHPQYLVTSGSVKIGNTDILELSPDERAQLGLFLAFQNPVEVPGLTVWQFLWQAYQQRFTNEKPKSGKVLKKAIEFFRHLEGLSEQVGLPKESIQRGLNEGFSGGEKKRLEMLQLLVLEPKFAILDESDSGLDIDAIKRVAQNIQTLIAEYNTACLVITHYQRLANYLTTDRVHIMVKGSIVDSGSSDLLKKIEKTGYQHYLK